MQLARSALQPTRAWTNSAVTSRAPARSFAPTLLRGLLPPAAPTAARMFSKTRSGVADSEAGPGELPDDARKYGSGHPFTQSAQDTQGVVTGCDEMKTGEEPPAAMSQLAHEVAEQDVEPQGQQQQRQQQQQQYGRGGMGGARGDNRQQMAQEGSAAATGGYSEGD